MQTQPAVRVGFELAIDGIEFYVFAYKDKIVIQATMTRYSFPSSSAKWGVHINAKYAIYRLLHMLHIKLHISAYFHCIFFAYFTNTVTVYTFAYF